MNIAIVDDEKVFISELKKTLMAWKPSNIKINIYEFLCGEDIIFLYKKEQTEFDIIFMDIKMGNIDGIETARQLRTFGFDNAIVFTSSNTDFSYVQQGFDVAALQYYEKPITVENIQNCMQHLDSNRKYCYLHNGQKFFIPYKEIEYFKSSKSRNYINIFTLADPSKAIQHRANLSSILNQTPKIFVQCYRSIIVNIEHIVMIKGSYIQMRANPKNLLPIGDQYIEKFLAAFTMYQK